MPIKSSCLTAIILGLALCVQSFAADDRAERPNIVFFYADDLGYGDLACYGSPVAQTPRLDALAREGTRFTQFYVSHCVCSPTRASAITGHFPGRHRIYGHIAFFEHNRRRKMPDWLDVTAPSFPRALQDAGYRTAMIGKWHLGGGSGRDFRMADLRDPDPDRPRKPGKVVINHPDAPPVAQYGFDHVRTTFGNSPTWKDAKPWPEPHETYPYACKDWSTWSSRAIADETIGFLKNHIAANSNQPFYVNVWFKDVHVILRPTDEMRKPFRHLDEKPQVHYAMVRYMDEQIGRVLDVLDELGLSKNTLVLFSSDNGAGKGRGGSCGALRGWKHTLYEGGIRVPLIVRWPGQVPAGRVDEQSILNICDFIPTFCELAGAKMPNGYQSDGEDITDALRGGSFERSKPQFWHYPTTKPSLAVRIGDWKLLTNPDGKLEELYNLADDISETTNLASDRSDIVKSLKAPLLKWYDELPLARESKKASAEPPLPWAAGSWTLVVLPDTQRYTDTRWDENLAIFRTMTQWMADNKKARNIKFVLHEGDITSGNTASVTPPNKVAAWQVASDAMAVLDKAGIPYSLTTGNHDHDRWNPFRNSPSRDTFLNDFFPVSRYKSVSTFGGVFEPGKTENNFHLFSAGGTDYITVALEWGPRNEAIAWADGVLSQHASRTALMVTHAYTYKDGTRYDWATKGTLQNLNPHCKSYGFSAPHDGSENVNDGEQLWQKLISKHANVRMVFSGHLNNGARQTSVGRRGQKVHEMMAAYHDPPEGYLRLLEFLPDGTTVQVRTYSPYLKKSLTDGNNQFLLDVEPVRESS